MKKICSRCLYDENVPSISFDAGGVCNYCSMHDSLEREYPLGNEGELRLSALFDRIKASGKGRPYDCVIGVSGGCDSSYLLYKAKQYGLRPLAAHFDNTWNSSIATTNIRNITKALNVDLYTYVVDNKEYDDIYRSFLQAGVLELDAPTDIGLATVQYMAAEKHGVQYIIEGHSFRTEGISPLGWAYVDGKYIESVQKQFGTMKLRSFPNLWLHKQLKWMIVNRFKRVRPLYYMDYRKEDAQKLMMRELGWQWYGGHHLENRISAFCHLYLIPVRFGYDLRLLGYSALVRSGQMTREQGQALLEDRPFFKPDTLALVELVKKRLGYSDAEFDALMKAPIKTYRDYETYKRVFERMRPFFWLMYKLELVPKSFYMKFTAPDPAPAVARSGQMPSTRDQSLP